MPGPESTHHAPFGERLLAMIPGEKRMVRYPGGHHVDLDRYGASDEAMKFFAEP